MQQTINFAHRGASAYCPENTIAAFRHAIELGATGIETDVQRTKDGRLVLIHDESLKRTAGDPRLVKDVEYGELAGLDAGSWFSASFAEERVPLLEELLELAKNTELILNLELKNGVVPYEGIEAEVISMVQAYGMSERILISSFNHYSLVQCKKIAPGIKTGILYMEGLYQPWEYAKSIQADALHAYKFAVLPQWVQEAAGHGIAYHPFTVNEENELERLVGFGVSGIITDYPDRLNALLRRSERS
ncbi:glycerophosphodiester phosphodiesterase [Paenibacillus sp. 1011MAR3C5]|uniref:glycerophosphodiester phosphodiesterase n=1 Tax=Paenibacillus sp. 1011MAR3C5 TaxID=1675787 RepID=UPI000E6B6923|nr:glycerophosphodiester phosphodiesterase [Paenibacillus sp. 1011MAR3C5]RJE87824.1 glycerophosphodiester phosphodiesterase [Paenibacillus sp. 1011MAR3C5]